MLHFNLESHPYSQRCRLQSRHCHTVVITATSTTYVRSGAVNSANTPTTNQENAKSTFRMRRAAELLRPHSTTTAITPCAHSAVISSTDTPIQRAPVARQRCAHKASALPYTAITANVTNVPTTTSPGNVSTATSPLLHQRCACTTLPHYNVATATSRNYKRKGLSARKRATPCHCHINALHA